MNGSGGLTALRHGMAFEIGGDGIAYGRMVGFASYKPADALVSLFVCPHDNFRTTKRSTINLGG